MTTRIIFPIRYKILAVLSAVVIAAVAFYLYLASRLFFEDKTVLVYELNESNVRLLASDVETTFTRVLDKLNLMATLINKPEEFAAAFENESELVKVAVLELAPNDGGQPRRSFIHVWPKYLESYKREPSHLETIREKAPIPFDRVAQSGLWIRNVTVGGNDVPPMMTIALKLAHSGANDGVERVIYADARLDHMLQAFSSAGIARTYAIDSEGFLLAHSEQERVAAGEDFKQDPLIVAAKSSQIRSEVKRFDQDDKSYLGSYFQLGLGGVIVASRVATDEAFAAAQRLIRKSLIYALVIITAAFLVALFFAHSLTEPIHNMLDATKRVAHGDFEQKIEVTTHDELARLAHSFNSMTGDLKTSRAQIEEYSRDLEKKVHQRTEQLEQQTVAIKEAQEALVRTTRLASVGEIAGRAAHEVLNPLTNINARLEKMQSLTLKADADDFGLLSEILSAWNKDYSGKGVQGLWQALSQPSTAEQGKTLLEEDLTNLQAIALDFARRLEERRADLDFLLKESSRINKIVNGMRTLTRVSADRRPVPLHTILEESLATMRDVLSKYKISTATQFAQNTPTVLADRDELIQVLSNLIRNSMQAIESARRDGKLVGEPSKIWISTQSVRRDDSGIAPQWVQIRVSDNGPGIDQENQARIFDSSFTTKSVQEGTGLGLSIARRFIRALDGEIILEKSIAAQETTFLIELPEMTEDGRNA